MIKFIRNLFNFNARNIETRQWVLDWQNILISKIEEMEKRIDNIDHSIKLAKFEKDIKQIKKHVKFLTEESLKSLKAKS